MLPSPCYRVSDRFDAGMSGGPVLYEYGFLRGIVCDDFDSSDEYGEPISSGAMLRPLFKLIFDADRRNNYPERVQYPAIKFAWYG